MKKDCFLLPTTLLICVLLNAQGSSQQFFLQHLDNRNGLSNSSINHIYTDADNLLWVGTWDGLNMYDGSNFHVFNYNRDNDARSIGSNVIQHILQDKTDNVWINTIEGISRYDKRSGLFHNYFYNQQQQSKVSEQEYQLVADTAGKIFCLSQKLGLTCYNAPKDTFETCGQSVSFFQTSSLLFDTKNRLWKLDRNGNLTASTLANGKSIPIKTTVIANVFSLFQVNGMLLFTTNDNKLFEINLASLQPKMVAQLPHALGSIIFYQNRYLLAWATKGYTVLDKNFQPSDFLAQEMRQIQDIRVTSMALGSEQILWVGTDGNGMIKIYPKTKSFGTIATADNENTYNKPVRTFCAENGNLWVGTKGGGIISFKHFWDSAATIKQSFTAPAQLDNNAVFCLKKGTDGFIYIGTDGKGLGVYDGKTNRFYKWASVKGVSQQAEFGSVYAILPDADSSVWLGTSGFGLVHLRLQQAKDGTLSISFLENYTNSNDEQAGPANDIIYSLAADNNQRIWIGCRYGGLSLLDKKTKKFRSFKAFTHEGSLSNNDVLSLYKDNKNRLWVGTSYGLNWLENTDNLPINPIFRKLTANDGLPNNTIHAITEDASGDIWVSTNKGLAKVESITKKIDSYQQTDGLQSNEFCDGALLKDTDGQLFFGGIYGFNHFVPNAIGKSNWLPNLLVNNMVMSGKKGNEHSFSVLHPQQNTPPAYSIERKDDFFELEIKALSFLNAEKCEYAYLLEGYDKAWHLAGTNGKISYSNIRQGNFTLKIKWSNGEGVWTSATDLLQLEVKQYYLLRPFAFAFYAMLLLVIIYVIYNYRKNRQLIKRQLEMEHFLRTKEEEMHQNRLVFFTNIAHELQTPLTLIMGSVERFLEKTVISTGQKKPYFLSLIHQQASRLTLLVQQLLEFRKAESGFYNPSQQKFIDLTELLTNLAEPFRPLGEQSNISYAIEIAPAISGITDKDKLEKIVFNLLSNAFKHSENGSSVAFKAKSTADNAVLEIVVSNSGFQLNRRQLDQLFENFYVSGLKPGSNKNFGTGIGLAFTKEMVGLLGGTIKASCNNNWINFSIQIPLSDSSHVVSETTSTPLSNPSYLYESITAFNETPIAANTSQQNRHALIDELSHSVGRTLLIVEDEPEIRYLLKDILKDDYIIYEASSGKEALELMQQTLPDLIICDVMMPAMNGLELCEKVKAAPATCHIPFIILSARDRIEHHTEGYEVGADAYIAKPFHSALLKVRIRKMLDNKQRLHELLQKDTTASTIASANLPDSDKELLKKMVVAIEENLDQPEFQTEQLEKAMLLSKMQLYRKLKTLTGLTPSDFIKQVRLKQAAILLSTTQLTVSEIFYRTGFNNQSYFFREFKKRYNAAPNEYREQQTTVTP